MNRVRLAAAMPVILCVLLILSGCGNTTTKLTGTSLDKTPAPDFTLTDQNGKTVTLSSLRGNAIALTFIYTNCTDICPLIAQKFHTAYQDLPSSTQQHVKLLAVTVDPARDNQAALEKFSQVHELADNPNWHAMTGDRTTLESVWKAYYIDASGMTAEDAVPTNASPTPTVVGAPPAHTDAIFIIDKDGNERVLMRSSVDPKDIAANLKTLAN